MTYLSYDIYVMFTLMKVSECVRSDQLLSFRVDTRTPCVFFRLTELFDDPEKVYFGAHSDRSELRQNAWDDCDNFAL
jgi:hypothetical protein